MVKVFPDEKIIPFTNEAKIGHVTILVNGQNVSVKLVKDPKFEQSIRVILVEDIVSEHIEHLTKHFADEATVTLTALHEYTENGLIFDLEVGGKNYRYIFKVTPEMLNTLQDSQVIVIYNPNKQDPLFLAWIKDCQLAMDQLTIFMLQTEAEKLS